ncbi:S-adenosylmethionine transporter [Blastocladiella emersonii ATCC 22665]|nr:S-adenosylmethionine transporter [Blastocladiella emersonii ATCC 22665]
MQPLLEYPIEVVLAVLWFLDTRERARFRLASRAAAKLVDESTCLWRSLSVSLDEEWRRWPQVHGVLAAQSSAIRTLVLDNVRDDVVNALWPLASLLESLTLRGWRTLSDHAFASLDTVTLPKLRRLSLEEYTNTYSALGSSSLARVACAAPNLEILHAWCNMYVDPALTRKLARVCPKLRRVSLSSLRSHRDEDLAALAASMPLLEYFAASHMGEITDVGIMAVADAAPRLAVLAIHDARGVTDVGVRHLAERCTGLHTVKMYDCPNVSLGIMEDLGFESVTETKALRHRPCFRPGLGLGFIRAPVAAGPAAALLKPLSHECSSEALDVEAAQPASPTGSLLHIHTTPRPPAMSTSIPQTPRNVTMQQALIAGAVAGTSVDTVLFPLDTIKTRLQSPDGFAKSGGFRGIFSGLLPAVVGSAPGAAAFFVTYEYCKAFAKTWVPEEKYAPAVHMASASMGEISACVIRVPTEVLKQRLQAGHYASTWTAITSIIRADGFLGFYRGYLSTVMREIPFTCVQFPLYEYFKSYAAYRKRQAAPDLLDAAFCGSVSGGIAAAVTTPLDVIKTRVMLATRKGGDASHYVGMTSTFKQIVREEGVKALFRGIGPRTLWISAGGFIFLGAYEKTKRYLLESSTLE